MYSSPLWGYFAGGAFSSAWQRMYLWSTALFVIVSVALAVRHHAARALVSRRAVMVAVGAISSLGVVLEYAACGLGWGPDAPLFAFGAALTGIGTAFISVKAGEIYARASAPTAVTNSALCEVASGLIFFMVVGTAPHLALAVAALLPLLAAVMALFDTAAGCETPALPDAGRHRQSISAFVRFLFVVFALTFAANAARGMMGAGADAASAANDAVAITFVVLIAFCVAVASSLFRSFRFAVIYYPLVLTLACALMVVFAFGYQNSYAACAMLAVYSLFSMFMWCVLAYIAHGRVWAPIQVFGWGRAVFAIGGLAGMVAGAEVVLPADDPSLSILVGAILAFIVLASAMLVFRESDVVKIIDAEGEEREVELPTAHEGAKALSRGPVVASSPKASSAEVPSLGRTIEAADFARQHGLTMRECEVFPLMLEGRDARAIGELLVISENTAKAHIRNIYGKVGAKNRQEFVEATREVLR